MALRAIQLDEKAPGGRAPSPAAGPVFFNGAVPREGCGPCTYSLTAATDNCGSAVVLSKL